MIGANWERLRQSTAADSAPAARLAPIHSATWAASSSTVSSRAALTRPGPAAGEGRSSSTCTLAAARSGAATWLATARIAWWLRQLVDSGSCRASDSSRNARGNRLSVVALAPRQP